MPQPRQKVHRRALLVPTVTLGDFLTIRSNFIVFFLGRKTLFPSTFAVAWFSVMLVENRTCLVLAVTFWLAATCSPVGAWVAGQLVTLAQNSSEDIWPVPWLGPGGDRPFKFIPGGRAHLSLSCNIVSCVYTFIAILLASAKVESFV